MKNEKINFKQIKTQLKNFFKSPKDVISFFLPIIITICLIIPMPYYIKLGGGTIKLNDKISIENTKKDNGTFEALYVKEAKAIVLTYLLSYVIPSFDREKQEEVILENENEDSYNLREKLYFTSSLDAATKVAFEKAGKEIKVSNNNFIVIYIDKLAKTNLKSGDKIKKINGVKITGQEQLANIIKSNKIGDKINITVERDKKKVNTTSTLIEIENTPKLGIAIANEIKYKSNPEVDFSFSGKQAGPSGGLMIALTIYNKLLDEDITKGMKVCGTGAIDIYGNVTEIGGIKHKLMAAKRKKADLVFVPEKNYSEAKKEKDKNGYKFDIVSVATFDDAVEYLKTK